MSEVVPITRYKLEILLYEDKPCFIATKVAELLGYRRPNNAVNRHCKYIIKLDYKKSLIYGLGANPRGILLIPEEDVVTLVSKCRSDVSEEVKQTILNQMPMGNYVSTVTKDESIAIKTIEQLLGISLIRQYPVGRYKVDGYHLESNTVYEIYEPYHNMRVDVDKERQDYIENKLGCNFVIIRV